MTTPNPIVHPGATDQHDHQPNWTVYQTAYGVFRRLGLDHDVASDKALYLACRDVASDTTNYYLIGKRAAINAAELRANRACVSLSTHLHHSDDASLTLDDTLPCHAQDDPERSLWVREDLRLIPSDIIWLFTDRRAPLTSQQANRVYRFRKRARTGKIQFNGHW